MTYLKKYIIHLICCLCLVCLIASTIVLFVPLLLAVNVTASLTADPYADINIIGTSPSCTLAVRGLPLFANEDQVQCIMNGCNYYLCISASSLYISLRLCLCKYVLFSSDSSSNCSMCLLCTYCMHRLLKCSDNMPWSKVCL